MDQTHSVFLVKAYQLYFLRKVENRHGETMGSVRRAACSCRATNFTSKIHTQKNHCSAFAGTPSGVGIYRPIQNSSLHLAIFFKGKVTGSVV